MPRLVVAHDRHIDAIYRESHALWGGGLDLQDYRGLWDELSQTPWGSRHARFYVWLGDGGRVLSSMKVYRPVFRIQGRLARTTVIGAVFTPTAMRHQGFAAAMLGEVVTRARARGEPAAILFSDIGTRYYETFGFHVLPAEEQRGALPRKQRRIPPGWSLAAATGADEESIRRAHEAFCATRDLAVVRDREHWHFVNVRASRFFERLDHPGMRQACRVARYEGNFAGYLIDVRGRGEWHVREVGARGGDTRVMATIVRLGARAALAEGLRDVYAWLPPGVVDELDEWPPLSYPRGRAVPMIAPLDPSIQPSALEARGAAYLPFQDQF